jgi:hypothetical protein
MMISITDIIVDRITKVQPEDIPNIGQVLLPQRLIQAEQAGISSNHDLGILGSTAAHANLLHHHLIYRVTVAQTGQDIVDGGSRPDHHN